MYYDDLPAGFTFETDSRVLSEEDILKFARDWDPQSFHTDPEAAKNSPYGGLIASGFQTILLAFVLTLEADIWKEASMGSPGMERIRWLMPVRPGDALRARGEVMSANPSQSRPDRGRVKIRYAVLNQADEMVAEFDITHILRRKG